MKQGDLAALITIRYDKPTEGDPERNDYNIVLDIPERLSTPLGPQSLISLLRDLADEIQKLHPKKDEEVSE